MERQRKSETPFLLIGEKKIAMGTTARIASRILKFSNDRRKLEVENFLPRHIEILAMAFGVTPEEIEENLTLADVIKKYLDCLEYVARTIAGVVEVESGKVAV